MIYFGSDHAGFELKEKLKEFLSVRGIKFEDLGNTALDPHDDYPDFIFKVARKVARDPVKNRGIVLGGSGQGEAMAANKVPGVRAAVFYGGPIDIIKLSREHNDANVLSLGARFLDERAAKDAVELWLRLQFSEDERHIRRIKKIEKPGWGWLKLLVVLLLLLAPMSFGYMLGVLGAAQYDWNTAKDVTLRLWGMEFGVVLFLFALQLIFFRSK